jgi:hypothetical protein
MATTTNVTYKRLSIYTWKELGGSKLSDFGGRQWRNMGVVEITAEIGETISIESGISRGFSYGFESNLGFESQAGRGFVYEFNSEFGMADDYAIRYAGIVLQEKLSIGEQLEGFSIQKNVLRDINLAELKSSTSQREFSSSFAVSKAYGSNQAGKCFHSEFSVVDDYIKTFGLELRRKLRLRELVAKDLATSLLSGFGLDGYFGKGQVLNAEESISVSDRVNSVSEFFRVIIESLSVADHTQNQANLDFKEELKTLDAFLRKADVALADMVLTRLSAGQDVDLETFENLITNGAMPDHSAWRDFVPGDYKYSKALFRVIIESQTEDRAQLQKLNVAVDVPDLFDRGTATISKPEDGATVEFSKHFHIIPDVTLTAKGGTGNPTAPEFSEQPNLIGFVVKMRDTITGEYVKGTCTWTASGY